MNTMNRCRCTYAGCWSPAASSVFVSAFFLTILRLRIIGVVFVPCLCDCCLAFCVYDWLALSLSLSVSHETKLCYTKPLHSTIPEKQTYTHVRTFNIAGMPTIRFYIHKTTCGYGCGFLHDFYSIHAIHTHNTHAYFYGICVRVLACARAASTTATVLPPNAPYVIYTDATGQV